MYYFGDIFFLYYYASFIYVFNIITVTLKTFCVDIFIIF